MARQLSSHSGLSLIEIMLALCISAIILTLGLPSLRAVLIQNHIVAEINQLSAMLQYGRSLAIQEQVNLRLCPTHNFTQCSLNWNQSKMLFADTNKDRKRDPTTEPLLAAFNRIPDAYFILGPGRSILFHDSGAVSSPATLRVCHKDKQQQYARAVTLSLQGRVKMSRDTNNDGIYEYNSGRPLRCD